MSESLECPACRQTFARHTEERCPRCGWRLGHLRPNSRVRALACGLAAVFLLVPAYALPVLSIEQLGQAEVNTIFSGVVKLWQDGLWGLALVVFTASIIVPAFKLTVLGLVLGATRWPALVPPKILCRLHSIVEAIGRWSMLDVFLVAFLGGIVRFGALASVRAQPGAVAFGAVVILTMLATAAYHPPSADDAAEPASR
ncbi:MAG TPA: paraquat-inducible protein A [Lacunisphaera sp.]|nr:paraquat-inducible protein A [Lacunisphaera sp.]